MLRFVRYEVEESVSGLTLRRRPPRWTWWVLAASAGICAGAGASILVSAGPAVVTSPLVLIAAVPFAAAASMVVKLARWRKPALFPAWHGMAAVAVGVPALGLLAGLIPPISGPNLADDSWLTAVVAA